MLAYSGDGDGDGDGDGKGATEKRPPGSSGQSNLQGLEPHSFMMRLSFYASEIRRHVDDRD